MTTMNQESEDIFHNDILQFVCFKLADEEYALDIANVREVILVPKITPVPQMPEVNLGIINIRGSVIPVFDLRKKLGLPQKEMDKKTKIVVAIDSSSMISFLVDEILENIKLTNEKIDPAPTVKLKIDNNCILGIGKIDDRMVTLLDISKIHDDIKNEIAAFSDNAD